MTLDFIDDDETRFLFREVIWVMQHAFGHSDSQCLDFVRHFYTSNTHRFDDDFYHHELAYRVAARIHYFEVVCGDEDGFREWYRVTSPFDTPEGLQRFYDQNRKTYPSK